MPNQTLQATIEKQADTYNLVIETPQKRITHPFVPIPEGSFMREGVEVSLSSFYMAQFAVTQELYEAVMGTKPSHFQGLQNPVEQVSWYDSIEFCIAFNKLLGISKPFYQLDKTTKDPNNENKDLEDKFKWLVNYEHAGKGVRLPTEAEWEYAARAGNETTYAGTELLEQVGWYDMNNHYETQPVGLKFPNAFGLYDMSGNVEEWCWDWYDDYPKQPQRNPKGANAGVTRVIRGGSWIYRDWSSVLANRNGWRPFIRYRILGFRLLFVP